MKVKGTVHKYGDNVDTDVIIPARCLNTSDPGELKLHCMEDIDKDFVNKVKKGDIIAGGKNFGCGSSREHAPIAIKASGISCVIAESFARIFYRNAINIGLPIVESKEASKAVQDGGTAEIDFDRGTITVKRTVTSVNLDGKYKDIEQDSAKTKSSLRTLPLVANFREYFTEVKAAQETNKRICGNAYNYQYDGYVFVDEMGDRLRPNYLTDGFPKLLEKHGLKRMRFHDLRHSCASILLANGVPLKQIQEWLGHSDFSTTANIYAHLDYSSKLSSAQAMTAGLLLPEDNRFSSKWVDFDGGQNAENPES